MLRPVLPGERIIALDVLRGWALFGVLWSNLNDHYGAVPPITPLDRVLEWTQWTLIESRFYALLAIMFGVGFGIQYLWPAPNSAAAPGDGVRGYIVHPRTANLLRPVPTRYHSPWDHRFRLVT